MTRRALEDEVLPKGAAGAKRRARRGTRSGRNAKAKAAALALVDSGASPVDAILRGDLRSSGSRSPSPHPVATRGARAVFRVPVVESVLDMPPAARSRDAAPPGRQSRGAVEKSGSQVVQGAVVPPRAKDARSPSPVGKKGLGKGKGGNTVIAAKSGSLPSVVPTVPGQLRKKKKKKGKGLGSKGEGKSRGKGDSAKAAPAANAAGG